MNDLARAGAYLPGGLGRMKGSAIISSSAASTKEAMMPTIAPEASLASCGEVPPPEAMTTPGDTTMASLAEVEKLVGGGSARGDR